MSALKKVQNPLESEFESPVSQGSFRLLPLYLIILLDNLSYSMLLPLLPLHAEKMGASPLFIGLISSSFSVCQMIASPYAGRLSDSFGRRKLLVSSQIVLMLSLIGLSLVNSVWLLLLCRGAAGASSLGMIVAQAHVGNHVEPANRTRAFSRIMLMVGLGYFLGPLLAGILSQYGFQVATLCSAIGIGISGAITARFISSDKSPGQISSIKKQSQGSIKIVSQTRAWFDLTCIFVFWLVFICYFSSIPLFLDRVGKLNGTPISASDISYCIACCGAFAIFVQIATPKKILNWLGDQGTNLLGFVSLAYGCFLLILVKDISTFLVAAAFFAIASGLLRPSLNTLLSLRAGKQFQGALAGVNQSVQAFARVVGPVFGGIFLQNLWITQGALALMLVSIAGMLVSYKLFIREINRR